MEIEYAQEALDDLAFWKSAGNKAVQQKIIALLHSIEETPFEGIGKPEPLKHEYSGRWSRRINKEHRMVYEVQEGHVLIYALRGHYKD